MKKYIQVERKLTELSNVYPGGDADYPTLGILVTRRVTRSNASKAMVIIMSRDIFEVGRDVFEIGSHQHSRYLEKLEDRYYSGEVILNFGIDLNFNDENKENEFIFLMNKRFISFLTSEEMFFEVEKNIKEVKKIVEEK